MRRFFLGVFAVVFLSACGGPVEGLSPTFSYVGSLEGFTNARAAAMQWNTTCGTGIVVTREPGHVPLEEVSDPAWAIEQSGLTTSRGREPLRVQVYAYTGERQKEIFAHEFGHALGLEHSPHDTNIMWAVEGGPVVRVVNAEACSAL